MAAPPSNTSIEQFARFVVSLWTRPNDKIAIEAKVEKIWKENMTAEDRSLCSQLIERLDEAEERRDLALTSQWIDLDAILQEPATSDTEEDKSNMAASIVISKGVVRWTRIQSTNLTRLLVLLKKYGLGEQTSSSVQTKLGNNAETVSERRRRIAKLEKRLATYNYVSLADQIRFVSGPTFKEGKVDLLLGYDTHGRIVKRRVRKTEELSLEQWNRTWRWKHDNQSMLIPNEHFLGRKCWDAVPYNFVKYDDFKVDPQTRIMTFYLDYCPYGDLASLHSAWNQTTQQPIPEPVLWHLFRSLTESCLVMEQGSYYASEDADEECEDTDEECEDADEECEDADEEWFQIVHRDIKPPNVFLDTPDQDNFPQYPLPKLGDFGLARETRTDDAGNPDIEFLWAGTPPYKAPEQNSRVRRPGDSITDPYKLLSHTNIWAIGLVMLEMVSGDKLDATLQKTYEDGPDEHQISEWAKDNYSKELRDLIGLCIKYWPDERITAEKLYAEIQEKMVANAKCSKYVQKAMNGQQPTGGPYDWIGEAERYKLDMASDPDFDMDSDDDDDDVTEVAGGVGGVKLDS